MGADNLKNTEKTRFSGQKAVENGRKGAQASAEAKRKKKSMIKVWETVRGLPLHNGTRTSIEEVQSIANVQGANLSVEEAMMLAMARKAVSGDVRAFEALTKFTDQDRAAQLARRAAELANKKAKLEIEQLEMQLQAYRSAFEQANESQVVILDDIPDETD